MAAFCLATFLIYMVAKQKPFTDEIKALLEEHKRIALYDLAMRKVDEVLPATSREALPVDKAPAPESIESRLKEYEEILRDLEALVALTAYWSDGEHQLTLQKVLARLVEDERIEESTNPWLRLRVYPFTRIMQVGGFAAIAAERYKNLSALIMGWTGFDTLDGDVIAIVTLQKAFSSLYEPTQSVLKLSGKTSYAPVSDYLFSSLQPTLDKLLIVGKRYEPFFDRYELLMALLHNDLVKSQRAFYGRFFWKYRRFAPEATNNPLVVLRKEAEQNWDNWPISKAGLFGGSFDRFDKAFTALQRQTENPNWW